MSIDREWSDALYEGRVEPIEERIRSGLSQKELDLALLEVAYRGHEKAVERFLAAGASARFVSSQKRTALTAAASTGAGLPILKMLIPLSDLSQKDSLGKTALEIAVDNGALDAVKAFLSAGADPNHVGELGQPLLMTAVIKDQVEITRALLEAGADAKATLPTGRTLFMAAATQSSAEIIELLAPYIDPAAVNERGENALMVFCSTGKPERPGDDIKALALARACGVEPLDRSGQSALDLARAKGKILIANALSGYQRAQEDQRELESAASASAFNASKRSPRV